MDPSKKMKVLVSGRFNIIHPGHLRFLQFAKACGEYLIVAVESDRMAGDGALLPESFRLESVKSNFLVDEAFIINERIDAVISRIKPDIVVKGREYEKKFNVELLAIENYGGKLIFSSGDSTFSSVDLIRNEFLYLDKNTINVPNDFIKRHKLNRDHLKGLIAKFSNLNVCVIGDLIVDEYITCQPLGMSQEDPTIVVTPVDRKKFVGGGGIVAAHAASLRAKVHFLSVAGEDESRKFAQDSLNLVGVNSKIYIDPNRPTTLKKRFRSKGKTLLRVSELHQDAISEKIQNDLYSGFAEIAKTIDLLVFSDFNYGCLPQSLVDEVIKVCKQHDIMMVADSQSSSQLGNICRFQGMSLVTPTEHEARLSLRSIDDGLVVLAENILKEAKAQNVFLKLGEEGFIIHTQNHEDGVVLTEKIEALNRAPKDTAGAGDSLLISSSMSIAAGGSIFDAAFIGAVTAAIQVGRVGNKPIEYDELIGEIDLCVH